MLNATSGEVLMYVDRLWVPCYFVFPYASPTPPHPPFARIRTEAHTVCSSFKQPHLTSSSFFRFVLFPELCVCKVLCVAVLDAARCLTLHAA